MANAEVVKIIDRLVEERSSVSYDFNSPIPFREMLDHQMKVMSETSTEMLVAMLEEVNTRRPGGFGEGFYAGEVYREIHDELSKRKAFADWRDRDKSHEHEVVLTCGIKGIVTRYGMEYKTDKWSVRTPVRGLTVGSGNTIKKAIENALSRIEKYGGAEKTIELINQYDVIPRD